MFNAGQSDFRWMCKRADIGIENDGIEYKEVLHE